MSKKYQKKVDSYWIILGYLRGIKASQDRIEKYYLSQYLSLKEAGLTSKRFKDRRKKAEKSMFIAGTGKVDKVV